MSCPVYVGLYVIHIVGDVGVIANNLNRVESSENRECEARLKIVVRVEGVASSDKLGQPNINRAIFLASYLVNTSVSRMSTNLCLLS